MNEKIARVTLAEYNPIWPRVFREEEEKILKAIGAHIAAIQHIGSTAITGAVSKPEIDIMIGVPALKDADACIKHLQDIGYKYFPKFEKFVPERRYFRKSEGIIPLFHIHMVLKSSDFWRNRILFRDYLRSNPGILQQYNALKEKMVSMFNGDRENYSKEKERFVLDILKIAEGNKAKMNIILKVAAVITNSKNEILLIRERYKKDESFKWNLVKGTYDNPNETIEDCMRREIKEEVCLNIPSVRLVKIYHYGDAQNPKILFIFHAECPNGHLSNVAPGKGVANEEIAEARWFTEREIKELPKHSFMGTYVLKSLFDGKEREGIRIERI